MVLEDIYSSSTNLNIFNQQHWEQFLQTKNGEIYKNSHPSIIFIFQYYFKLLAVMFFEFYFLFKENNLFFNSIIKRNSFISQNENYIREKSRK